MEKSCQNTREQIPELLTGSLPGERAAELRDHISACVVCRAYLKALQADDELFGDFAEAMQPSITRLESKVVEALADARSAEPAGRTLMLRTILKSRIIQFTAAAVIVAAMALLIHRGNGSLDIATPAFAQMIEAMEKMPWLHIVTYNRVGDYYGERWFSYRSEVLITCRDGKVQYLDYSNNKRTVYEPSIDTVTITYLSTLYDDLYDVPRSMVGKWIEAWKANDAEIRHERSQYEGIDVDIYYCTSYSTHQGRTYVSSQKKLIVDRSEHVPILSESKYWDSQGKVLQDSSVIWDYPAQGPKDIYEAGVPPSAKVLDYSPTPELLSALEAYGSHRDGAPQRYIAIIVYAGSQPGSESYVVNGLDIFYCNGINRRRLEVFRFRPKPLDEFIAQCGDSFDSLMRWRRAEKNGELDTWVEETVIYDGKYRYSQRRSNRSEAWPAVEKVYVPGSGYRLPMGSHIFWRDILSEVGWPNSLLHITHARGKTSVVQNDYSRGNNLICVEVLHEELHRENTVVEPAQKRLYYLNPERDYICERQEIHPQLGAARRPAEWFDEICPMVVFDRGFFSVGQVVEYGRTDLGQWYAKKILMRSRWDNDDGTTEERKKVITVHVDADPQLPEGIFHPGELPKASE